MRRVLRISWSSTRKSSKRWKEKRLLRTIRKRQLEFFGLVMRKGGF